MYIERYINEHAITFAAHSLVLIFLVSIYKIMYIDKALITQDTLSNM